MGCRGHRRSERPDVRRDGCEQWAGGEAAKALVKAGAHVILACRNVDKGKAVAAPLGERAEVRRLDLADLASVREFADSVDAVDVLVNNAGVMAVPLGRTADGFEMQSAPTIWGISRSPACCWARSPIVS